MKYNVFRIDDKNFSQDVESYMIDNNFEYQDIYVNDGNGHRLNTKYAGFISKSGYAVIPFGCYTKIVSSDTFRTDDYYKNHGLKKITDDVVVSVLTKNIECNARIIYDEEELMAYIMEDGTAYVPFATKVFIIENGFYTK